jgi:hypothetical protein
MVGKIVQPQTPLLAAQLPLDRIAMLVECFKIAENPDNLVSGNAKSIAIFGPLG